MRHFAVDSGKSKGQFLTPAEASRVVAKVTGIGQAITSADTTVHDPTCGSASLLLKVADEARTPVTLYGQEKDAATTVLARMNMILHDNPTALIVQGNTLTDPKFRDGRRSQALRLHRRQFPLQRQTLEYRPRSPPRPLRALPVFRRPPGQAGRLRLPAPHRPRRSRARASAAVHPAPRRAFPGQRRGRDPRNLVRRGYIQAIIGLPPNLFYGTGIPACIVVVDKAAAHRRDGIFMIDASAGFMKDGPKNRLRAQDIHRIVDVFTRQADVPKYARMVPYAEIEQNDYNLNLPRYIDSQAAEDLQDIAGHLQGGIPAADVNALAGYWRVLPQVKQTIFAALRPGYFDLAVEKTAIKQAIYAHPEFVAFTGQMNELFAAWRARWADSGIAEPQLGSGIADLGSDRRASQPQLGSLPGQAEPVLGDPKMAGLKSLQPGFHPKELVTALAEDLLAHYTGRPLVDKYAIYQHFMDFWAETMQDDCYLIAADGWRAQTTRLVEVDKKGRERDKGWTCDLAPKALIVARYFAAEQAAIAQLEAELESIAAQLAELEEEQGGDEGAFAELDKVNKAAVTARLREIDGSDANAEAQDEAAALELWLELSNRQAAFKKELKEAEADLDAKAYAKYPTLSEDEVKALVVDDKWMAALGAAIGGEVERISQALTQRVKELAERYATPLPALGEQVADLERRVAAHLERMGFAWN
jgi:type I restriction enzyme M protein